VRCKNIGVTKIYGIPLTVTHPDVAKQADGWDPEKVTASDKFKRDWKCSKGHKWSVTTINRTFKNRPCPYCSGSKVIIGSNDFATLFPHLLKFVDGWDPTRFKSGSNKRLNWKCPIGHSWKSKINAISRANPTEREFCPFCTNQKVWIGFNDLRTTHQEIAQQAYEWDPTTVVAGSHKKRLWKCELGHIWEAIVHSRTKPNGTGCPYCSNLKVWIGFNDLKTRNPNLAKEADGWDPTTVTSRAKGKKDWKCEKNHKWSALLGNRGKGVGCPYCANQKAWEGFNDLDSQFPDIAKEAFGWNPKTVVSRSNRNLQWKCPKGHTYKATPGRRIQGDACPICSGHQVLEGFNDLKTLNPSLAREAEGWDPKTVTWKSNKRRKWRCSYKHTWTQSVSTRAAGIGCPTCAKTGYDPNKDGYLYFLGHETWGMLQIGITNDPKSRLTKHERNGWEAIEIRGPMDGHLTQQWETAILRMLKAKGADLANSKIAGKFDGYSEAWSKSRFSAKSIRQLMDLTQEYEESLESKRNT